ncbi:MurR/RpiR family transcriptional regulator [Citreimonas salinaria]|uniref:Transcriptional regulator, RpiR family n=1 Tax=Citreimonas salinaria TaxID=321339 RepID=A0A1H3MM62_9RHOB|nr:MurR/RpiR family transcriptional regulator [Citreimonas salinaria]SDY77255.1 transcriptional regulator, RpiR family [Citreimonas salinaria]
MSVLTLIEARLGTLTEGERQIARTILDDPEGVLRQSSADLARLAGRSQSGVVKFCQKLGFSGFQDLKIEISQATARRGVADASGIVHGSIEAADDLATTAQKLLGSKIRAMQETLSVNGAESLDTARDALAGARQIQLVGVGASSLVARDFGYKLQKLGRRTTFDADSHIQMANAATLGQNDLMLAISQSGQSLETLRIAETAARRGATLLSVTGLQTNPLSGLARIALFTVDDEERVRSSAITSRDAQLMLLDLLFLRLVQSQDDAADLIRGAIDAVAPLKL